MPVNGTVAVIPTSVLTTDPFAGLSNDVQMVITSRDFQVSLSEATPAQKRDPTLIRAMFYDASAMSGDAALELCKQLQARNSPAKRGGQDPVIRKPRVNKRGQYGLL